LLHYLLKFYYNYRNTVTLKQSSFIVLKLKYKWKREQVFSSPERLTQVPQICPLADTVHYKYSFTYSVFRWREITVCGRCALSSSYWRSHWVILPTRYSCTPHTHLIATYTMTQLMCRAGLRGPRPKYFVGPHYTFSTINHPSSNHLSNSKFFFKCQSVYCIVCKLFYKRSYDRLTLTHCNRWDMMYLHVTRHFHIEKYDWIKLREKLNQSQKILIITVT